ncbi:hypothetical protein [Kribbella hippodromi]
MIHRFRCGIKRYGSVASSVSGSIPADAPSVSSSGQQVCQADLSVRNIGKQRLKNGVHVDGPVLTAMLRPTRPA